MQLRRRLQVIGFSAGSSLCLSLPPPLNRWSNCMDCWVKKKKLFSLSLPSCLVIISYVLGHSGFCTCDLGLDLIGRKNKNFGCYICRVLLTCICPCWCCMSWSSSPLRSLSEFLLVFYLLPSSKINLNLFLLPSVF